VKIIKHADCLDYDFRNRTVTPFGRSPSWTEEVLCGSQAGRGLESRFGHLLERDEAGSKVVLSLEYTGLLDL
jgi:hypothetical protein